MAFRWFGKSRQSDYRYRGSHCYGNEYTRADLISKFKMYLLDLDAQVHLLVCLEHGSAVSRMKVDKENSSVTSAMCKN